MAPAENVYSTLNSEQPGGPKYGRRNTTVGSAAMVAGVANRLKDLNSDLEGDDLRQILRRTADDIPPEGYDKETGYGRLNAKAAVDYLTERSISQGVVTGGDVTILEDGGTSFTMVASPWTDLASQKYFPDERYKVQWTIDLPEGSDHDVWVRRSGTKGWTTTNPTTGIPGATIEVRSWESEATITTYGYQGEIYDILGRLIGTYGHPVEAGDAKVAYTVATKPGTPPPPPLQASLSGPSTLDSGEEGTWTASVSGGSGSPSYDWEHSTTGLIDWQSKSCTGASCSHTFFNDNENLKVVGMRVIVTKGTETDTATAYTDIQPPDGSGCSPTDPCIAGASLQKGPAVLALQASSQGDAVRVQWRTSGGPSVTETSPFVVQHRADSTGTWSELGDVAAADSTGKSASVSGTKYQFETTSLPVGVHQFRLAVDQAGKQGRPGPPSRYALALSWRRAIGCPPTRIRCGSGPPWSWP